MANKVLQVVINPGLFCNIFVTLIMSQNANNELGRWRRTEQQDEMQELLTHLPQADCRLSEGNYHEKT